MEGADPPHLVGAMKNDAVEGRPLDAVCDGMLTLPDTQYIVATGCFER